MRLNPLTNKVSQQSLLNYLKSRGIDYNSLTPEAKALVLTKLQTVCSSCPLSSQTKYRHLPAKIIPNSFCVTIGRNPSFSESEEATLYPKTTRMGMMYHKYLNILNLSYQQVSELNSLYCCSRAQMPPSYDDLSVCCMFKPLELDIIKPKLILLLGNHANALFFGLNSPSVLTILGSIYQVNSRIIVPLPHPSQLIMYPELFQDVSDVLTKVKSLLEA